MANVDLIWAVVALAVIAATLVIAAAVLIRQRRLNATREHSSPYAEFVAGPVQDGEVWVVANPVKPPNFEKFKSQIDKEVARATGRPARWIETTVADPGTGQAVEALRHRPALVLAAGGDGTVRAVAAGMAHSRVPMGLLPMGTGNLLARNLGIPLDPDEAIRIALTPVSRRVDLAWLRVERVEEESKFPAEGRLLQEAGAQQVRTLPEGIPEPRENEYSYLVIAGVGFDGETMANTRPELKKRVGWSAYVLSAFPSLRIERMKATVTVVRSKEDAVREDARPRKSGAIPQAVKDAVRSSSVLGSSAGTASALRSTDEWDMSAVRARTVLFANCGDLPFAQIAPNAKIDDGQLDVVAIDTQGGLIGWAYLTLKVMGNQAGLVPINVKNDLATIQFRQTPLARVDISKAYPVQVDGDAIGTARTVVSRVSDGALLVRVPSGSPAAIPDWDRRI